MYRKNGLFGLDGNSHGRSLGAPKSGKLGKSGVGQLFVLFLKGGPGGPGFPQAMYC
jgi:hypothetical protein